MDDYESLSHTKWECNYHVVFIPKCRRKTLYTGLRKHLGEVFRRLAAQKESRIEEGHLMSDHVHMLTGASAFPSLANQTIHPYSDFAIHHMGPGLADQISQGQAGGDEFRSAPLWGLGQRLFFLHDGRTSDLLQVIRDHSSAANAQFPASEANRVVTNYFNLSVSDQQAVLTFLRSL